MPLMPLMPLKLSNRMVMSNDDDDDDNDACMTTICEDLTCIQKLEEVKIKVTVVKTTKKHLSKKSEKKSKLRIVTKILW